MEPELPAGQIALEYGHHAPSEAGSSITSPTFWVYSLAGLIAQ